MGSGADWEQLTWALCTEVSLKDIKRATKHFDSSLIIGVGRHGNVHGGVLNDGKQVAVKRWTKNSKNLGLQNFQNELSILSKLKHKNLIWIGGSFTSKGEIILLFEYMKNGTLMENLYSSKEGCNKPYLSWTTRLEICIEVAKALYYLHDTLDEKHVHGDLNTKNIFLDEEFKPKVSGFSYSKRVSKLENSDPNIDVSDANVSPGYLDPEAMKSGKLTQKSDVYAFGVVLLEVLCARPAIDTNLPKNQINLVNWVLECDRKGNLEKVVDVRLRGKICPEGLSTYVDIAKDCLAENGIQRPYLCAVEESLEHVLCMQGPDGDEDICGSNRDFQVTWNSIDVKQKHKKNLWKRIGNKFIEAKELVY